MNSTLKLSAFQNKLSIRIDSKLRLLDFFVGFLLFILAEYLLIVQHLFLFSTAINFFAIYGLQDAYKRRKNAIDISNLFIFPSNKTKLIRQYMMMDFFEYKTIFILIHLTLVSLYYNIVFILFTALLFICFSLYLTLHNFLIKRFHWAFQLLTRAWVVLILFPFMIITNKENREITFAFYKKIEQFIDYHNYSVIFSISIICLFTYFLIMFLIKKILITTPFVNQEIMKKVNTFV